MAENETTAPAPAATEPVAEAKPANHTATSSDTDPIELALEKLAEEPPAATETVPPVEPPAPGTVKPGDHETTGSVTSCP